ncbi:MAG: Hpt domain-containing protein [Eubacterium sp.]|nr:Hpt domain-containing protein [Eubacterium sp.]
MLTTDALKEYGADVAEGLGRCMGNEAFYFRMIKLAAADTNVEKLKDALAQNDLQAAFEAAHALKGVMTNLALKPIADPVIGITEHLRAGEQMDYQPAMEIISSKFEELKALCAE